MQSPRAGVSRTFQNVRLFPYLTVRENVEVAARVGAQQRPASSRTTEELLTQFGLAQIADRKAGTLPYGHQRQVEMARAVALCPDLLLLDEPAAGMNDRESEGLVKAIRGVRDAEGCAVLLIDHDLHFVLSLCERLYVLDAGVVIAAGTPDEIRTNERVKEAYLGTRAGRMPARQPEPSLS